MIRLAEGRARSVRLGTDEVIRPLKQAFDASPLPGSPMPGVTALTVVERECWQSIQSSLCPGTMADADVACLLAYFGVDYYRNVRRVLRSCTLRSGQSMPHGDPSAFDALARIPGHAARLYHRWRDPEILDWLLARRRLCPNLLEAEHEALLSLWDDHWMEILRAAKAGATARVAAALAYARPLVPEPLVWAAYLRHLNSAAETGEAALRCTALEVLAQLRACHEAVLPNRGGATRDAA